MRKTGAGAGSRTCQRSSTEMARRQAHEKIHFCKREND